MPETNHFVEVAVPLPIRKTFAYEVPEELRSAALPGKGVVVPFGRRFLSGFVLGPAKEIPPGKKILPIRQVLDDEASISKEFLALMEWLGK